VANGFAFGVWPAHISVFKQTINLATLGGRFPQFTLALGAVLTMPFVGRVFHRIDSSAVASKGQICYAAMLSLSPWTRSLAWLAISTFCFGSAREPFTKPLSIVACSDAPPSCLRTILAI
jgi:hypothetical protein